MDLWRRLHDVDEMKGPRAWIQWKGTDACMDVYCRCGTHGHVDDEFAYFYLCPGCKQIWAVGSNVRLHELTEDEQEEVRKLDACLVEGEDT